MSKKIENHAISGNEEKKQELRNTEKLVAKDVDLVVAPDGGWGWVVMIASFFSNLIVDGVCYTFGIFFTELVDYFGSTKSETALVGALVPGMYLIVGESFVQEL
jgi:hypothetical protein